MELTLKEVKGFIDEDIKTANDDQLSKLYSLGFFMFVITGKVNPNRLGIIDSDWNEPLEKSITNAIEVLNQSVGDQKGVIEIIEEKRDMLRTYLKERNINDK